MRSLIQIVLMLYLSVGAISNVNGQKCQKEDFENSLKIPDDVQNVLQEHLQKFNDLTKKTPSERKTKFLDLLLELSSRFEEPCGFWERDYYKISRRCQFTDPCNFSEQAQEVLEELFDNHGNLGEVIQALGTRITADTFVYLERYLYVLPEQAEDKMLPNLFNIDLDKWNLKPNPKDSKLQFNVKELFNKFFFFQQYYGACLHLEDSREFFHNHHEYIKRIDYAQYKRMLDSAEDLETIAYNVKEILMDMAIVLSAEKAKDLSNQKY